MKEFEYVGVLCAVFGYLLIVMGSLHVGFWIGLTSSICLFVYFISIKSFATVGLQSFFICANIYGIFTV